jgi:hypothetical protein
MTLVSTVHELLGIKVFCVNNHHFILLLSDLLQLLFEILAS